MKETELLGKDSLEVTEVAPITKEKRFEQRYLPKKGHTCFEFDTETKELRKAKFDVQAIEYPTEGLPAIKRREITFKPNCIYVFALNEKNAVKKLLKMMNNGK